MGPSASLVLPWRPVTHTIVWPSIELIRKGIERHPPIRRHNFIVVSGLARGIRWVYRSVRSNPTLVQNSFWD